MPISTRELHNRLRKLESRRPPRIPDLTEQQKYLNFRLYAVAHYLGDWNKKEALVTAYARALGYQQCELLKSWKLIASGDKDLDYDQKDALAMRKLFAKFGVDLDTSDGKEIEKALKRMEAGLPEDYRRRMLSSYRDHHD